MIVGAEFYILRLVSSIEFARAVRDPGLCARASCEPVALLLWADSEPAIGHKSSPSYEVKESDIRRAVAATAELPSSTLPDSPFILALGTPAAQNVPPQTGTLAQRALEEWERTLCENKAVTILEQMQAGRLALIQKDGGEMLIAIVLDRPLAEAKALVDDPAAFSQEMTKILLEKQSHPLIA